MNMNDNGFDLRNFLVENRKSVIEPSENILEGKENVSEAMGEDIDWMQTAIEDYLDDEQFKDAIIRALSNDQAKDIFEYIMRMHEITPREEYPEADDMPGFEGTKGALKGLGIREERVNEGYVNNIEDACYAVGYDNCLKFFEDNQGALSAVIDWMDSVPEFRNKLRDFERNL